MKRLLYALLKFSNDAKAVNNDKVGKRIGRRVYGKVSGKIARSIFK